MMRRGAVVMAAWLACTTGVLGQQVYLREADAVRVMYPASTSYLRQNLALSDQELERLSKELGRASRVRNYPYVEVKQGDSLLGWLFVLDVLGQSSPITFAVAVSPLGVLQQLQVMAYREPRGQEVREPRFRRQFEGKRLADALTLGHDVDAVSGATISCRSATYAARKSLALADLLRARERKAQDLVQGE